ncbi:MAG: hypothetical protein ACRDCE_23100 [Cetobacterium sp.]|uniref:hypothetical protein n=1 Tax=Cetobacterium sp. TaxID=2071632 RepID=UPI003EE44641
MSFFSDLGSKAFAPVKAGSESLYHMMQDLKTPDGALSGAISDEEQKKKIMPSATGMLLQQYQPGHNTVLAPQPNTQQLGQMAAKGSPIFTDSSEQTVFTPDSDKERKFDLQSLGEVLKSVKPTGSGGMSQVSSGRAGGRGFSFDKSLYTDPLIQREFNNLYMAPLYQDLMPRR